MIRVISARVACFPDLKDRIGYNTLMTSECLSRKRNSLAIALRSTMPCSSSSINNEDSPISSLGFETPASFDFLANKCDTCGKSFLHSSSYRRHSKTPCRSRKRRRLWLPEESDNEELEDVGVTALFDASQSGNIGEFCMFRERESN